MDYTLHAVFLEIDNKLSFHKYYWDGMDAFHIAEIASQLINKGVTGYKLEEHLVSKNFDFRDPKSYIKISENYKLIS